MNVITEYKKRPWDISEKYASGKLFQTDFWTVEVSYRQHTPASYIIFLNRYETNFSKLTKDEISELPEVMNVIENCLLKNPSLKPQNFNYLQLGNTLHHFHLHCIPRYENLVTFVGRDWKDTEFGRPPVWTFQNSSDEEVQSIRNELLKYLEVVEKI
jgi:diadenosine tetraphosphate (Ap4A) HIT family hydrolase